MKAFLSSIAVALVIAVGAAAVLGGMQTNVEKAFTTQGVRL
ncbi:hypothetical protein [Indioceanicola profundi]|nr:hypothetical protein [Indioceanicola profundi]